MKFYLHFKKASVYDVLLGVIAEKLIQRRSLFKIAKPFGM